MSKIHLPEDIGDTPSKLGAKDKNESYSITLATDQLLQYADAFPPVEGSDEIIFRPTSPIATDVFALPKRVKTQVLFEDVSTYALDPSQWDLVINDTSGGGDSGDQSVIWTNRLNFRAEYPGAASEGYYVPEKSAVMLRLLPFNQLSGLQQAILFSKRKFRPTALSPIFATMAVQMSLTTSADCIKEWGLLGGNSGFFFRVKGNGQGDRFSVGYRYTLGGSTREVEIPRRFFNSNRLDGTGESRHQQTFINVAMFGIEVGTSGFGVRFWAYVTTRGLPRWVLIHHLADDSDSSISRLVDEEAFPLSFAIRNSTSLGSVQELLKFGTSVASFGSPIANTKVFSASSNNTHYTTREFTPLVGVRLKESLNNTKNSRIGIPSDCSFFCSHLAEFLVLRRKSKAEPGWTSFAEDSLTEYNITKTDAFSEFEVLTKFFCPANSGQTKQLSEIFKIQRSFLSNQYTNDSQVAGDTGQQFLLAQDEVWICVRLLDNAPAIEGNEQVLWEQTTLDDFIPIYEDEPQSSALASASLNILEV